MLHRSSRRIGKKVTPHVLRHSCATYYANHLTHFQLCYRYGWAMSSNMPNRYLDREGMYEENIPTIIKALDAAHLEKQNQVLNEQLQTIKESNNEMQKQFVDLSQKYDKLMNGKNFIKLIDALATQNCTDFPKL